MSHDRGCSCGKERWEYRDCTRIDCIKIVRSVNITPMEINTLSEIEGNLIKYNPHGSRSTKMIKMINVLSGIIANWEKAKVNNGI
jgi:hypothetical protein